MGAGIAWLFSLFIAMLIAGVLGVLFWLIAYSCVRKKQFDGRQNLLILTALTPYLFIIMEFVLITIADVVVSIYNPYVSWNVGYEWYVPINDDYYLYAMELPERACVQSKVTRKNVTWPEDTISAIWVKNDTTIILSSNTMGDKSIYVLYPHIDNIDTLLCEAKQIQLDSVLANKKLDYESSMNPDAYFRRGQSIAHKYDIPIRHAITLFFIGYLWFCMIRRIRRNKLSVSKE